MSFLSDPFDLSKMRSFDDLEYLPSVMEVHDVEEGQERAITFFAAIYPDLDVFNEIRYRGPRSFMVDETKEGWRTAYVTECYIDPGSVDYFYFYYIR